MNAERKTIDNLREMVSLLRPGGIGHDDENSFKSWGFQADGIHVETAGASRYVECSRAAHESKAANDYDYADFEKRVVSNFFKTVQNGDPPTDSELKEFLKTLESEKTFPCLVTRELHGAHLANSSGPLALGPFIIYNYKLHKNHIHPNAEVDPQIDGHAEYLIGINVEAKTIERAKQKADEQFEVFERLVRFMVGPNTRFEVNVFGAHGRYSENAYIFSDGRPLSQQFTWKGSIQSLPLDNEHFRKEETGMNLLWNATKNSSTPALHQRLMNAAKWLGDSYLESDKASAFIKAAIALEVLFTSNEKSIISPSILSSISESVACILGDDLKTRISLEKRLKDHYSTRSAIAHSGKNNVSQSDVEEFRWMVRQAIARVMGTPTLRDLGTIEKLHEHLKSLKYSFAPIH
ncbi:HEPN domain-containing protein [Stenotrophomonas maltophilia]|uniref:HEPN domain-containing protein n=1 Tax=Stenotrophomonas maltophilia TaxID=40324 RepID=UPI001660421D